MQNFLSALQKPFANFFYKLAFSSKYNASMERTDETLPFRSTYPILLILIGKGFYNFRNFLEHNVGGLVLPLRSTSEFDLLSDKKPDLSSLNQINQEFDTNSNFIPQKYEKSDLRVVNKKDNSYIITTPYYSNKNNHNEQELIKRIMDLEDSFVENYRNRLENEPILNEKSVSEPNIKWIFHRDSSEYVKKEPENSSGILPIQNFIIENKTSSYKINNDINSQDVKKSEGDRSISSPPTNSNYYIYKFEHMMKVVLEKESFLFCQRELKMLEKYWKMSLHSRYLFIRLFMRKNSWIPLNSLDSHGINIQAGINELTGSSDLDDKIMCKCIGHRENSHKLECDGLLPLAISESRLENLKEVLDTLPLKKLQIIIKEFNILIKGKRTINTVVDAILKQSKSQTVLSFKKLDKLELKSVTSEGEKNRTNDGDLLSNRILIKAKELLGKSVKLNERSISLFKRLFVIYARTPIIDQKSTMTTALLTSYGKLNFPSYPITRTSKMFKSRESVINYNRALQIEYKADSLSMYLRAGDLEGWKSVLDICLPSTCFWAKLIGADFSGIFLNYSPDFEECNSNFFADSGIDIHRTPVKYGSKFIPKQESTHDLECIKHQKKHISSIVNGTTESENYEKKCRFDYWRRRFTCGWVLTRIAEKCSKAFSALNMYREEAIILRALLGQSLFRLNRRGKWHRRLALITMNYLLSPKPKNKNKTKNTKLKSKNSLPKSIEPVNKFDESLECGFSPVKSEQNKKFDDDLSHGKPIRSYEHENKYLSSDEKTETETDSEIEYKDYIKSLFECRMICISAIIDSSLSIFDLIHIDKRLNSIDNKLEIPENLRFKLSKTDLNEATEVIIHGIKSTGRNRDIGESVRQVWEDNEGELCSVEQVALGYYINKGYCGVHSESSIVTSLFGLIFWDILFFPIDGVFDTEYQSHPLDMFTDAFYQSKSTFFFNTTNNIVVLDLG
ncbi:Fanconi-associated nuclease 1 [Smittium mucronatum]|uniref:Fanconi-associated nuclease n=1 Tax=Smittium mucronatum TaxID=133383 RepID=A0A1R0GPB2_9FUNG|nr:Fanconi-associated nuclease 1 [Smittium mucronatum]